MTICVVGSQWCEATDKRCLGQSSAEEHDESEDQLDQRLLNVLFFHAIGQKVDVTVKFP